MSFAMIGVYAGKGILLSVKLGEFDRFLILRYILRIHTLQIRPQVYQSSLASVSGNTLSVICPDDIRRCACSQHQVYLIIGAGTRNRNEIHMNSLGFHRFINPACQFIVRQGIPRGKFGSSVINHYVYVYDILRLHILCFCCCGC